MSTKKFSLPAIASAYLQAKKIKNAEQEHDDEIYGFNINRKRKNSLVTLLKQDLKQIKDAHDNLCLLFRQDKRHHIRIEKHCLPILELISQQHMSYLLIAKIINLKQDLEHNIKAFYQASERDTGQEKYPLHHRKDICRIKEDMETNGRIESNLNIIQDAFNEQLAQTLRVLEHELYALSGSNSESAMDYLLNNINNQLIKNYIIRKGNGISQDNENSDRSCIIGQIMTYYHNFMCSY